SPSFGEGLSSTLLSLIIAVLLVQPFAPAPMSARVGCWTRARLRAAGCLDLRDFLRLSCLFGTASMVIEDGLGPGKVSRLNPDLGAHARNVADAGAQVVAEHLTANALLLERLLPDVGLERVRGRGEASNLVLICRMHDI